MTEIYLWTEKTTKNILRKSLGETETSYIYSYQDVSCTSLKTVIKNNQRITGLHLAYSLTHESQTLPEWDDMYQVVIYNDNGNGTISPTILPTGLSEEESSVIVDRGWSITGVNTSNSFSVLDSSKNVILLAGTVFQPLSSIGGQVEAEAEPEQTLANFVNTTFDISNVIGISNEMGQLIDQSIYTIGKPPT